MPLTLQARENSTGGRQLFVGFVPKPTVDRVRRITRARREARTWDSVHALYGAFAAGVIVGTIVGALCF